MFSSGASVLMLCCNAWNEKRNRGWVTYQGFFVWSNWIILFKKIKQYKEKECSLTLLTPF